MFIYRCVDKEWPIYNEIVFIYEREGNLAFVATQVDFEGIYAKWNKSDTERQVVYVLIYM